MTFEVGRLSAAITLDGVQEFHRDLDNAGQKLQATGQQGKSFGKAAEAAVRSAAGATTGLVAAGTAYLTILAKQGVAYNSMQQNSRAALNVIMGGAEKANAQMAKLDDFARNSPFSKSVFIQAQQQLLGFGMEAERVVPTLDAVQQSMAAMGRGNEDIAEVVNILAQLESTGKITAETLNQLGVRGIDAAELIGKGMNQTGNEIRDSITKGTLDGREALTILVDEMQAKYGGAADGIKTQWVGAVDRIKAAQRDLGSHLAEPFVSAQGGGMAVTWANQVADVLRAIEKQAIPVMGILTQRGMPFFASLAEGLDSAAQATKRWDANTLNTSLDKLAHHAPGIGALAGATFALGAQVGPLGKLLQTLGISANPVVAAFVGLALASPEVRDALKGVLDAGKPLAPIVMDIATALSGSLNTALPIVAGGIDLFAGVLGIAVNLLEKIPTPVLIGAAAFLAMHKATESLNSPLSGVLASLSNTDAVRAFNAELSPSTVLLAGFGDAASAAKTGVTNLGKSIKNAFLANPIGIALTVVAAAIGLWAKANADAQQKVQEHNNRVAALKNTLDETTGAITDATKAQVDSQLADSKAIELAERMGVSYGDMREAILGNDEALQKVTEASSEWAKSHVARFESAEQTRAAEQWAGQTVEEFTEILAAHKSSVEAAQEAKKKLIQADRDAASAMSEAGRSNARFNDALAVARDTTKDAESRVRALKQALDELKGGTISAEEAQIKLTRTTESLAEGLARADEDGNLLWASMLDGAGVIDTTNGVGADFAEMMGRSRDAMLDAARAASDQALANGDVAGATAAAQAAGDNYIATLRKTMEDAGLTAEQIDGLVGSYLDVPSVVATLLTDNGSISEVDQQLLNLAVRIEATPDKTITIDEPLSPAIKQRLRDLGYQVEDLPDGKIQITQSGAEGVARVLESLSGDRWATVRINEIVTRSDARQSFNGPGYADGGLVTSRGKQFSNGGFVSGIYAGVMGGIPKMGADGVPHIFGEKHLGLDWETYISPKASRERNAALLMETSRRIGLPMIPLSALQGPRAFAHGGMVGGRAPAMAVQHSSMASAGSVTNWNMQIVNPIFRDDFQDAWERAQEED